MNVQNPHGENEDLHRKQTAQQAGSKEMPFPQHGADEVPRTLPPVKSDGDGPRYLSLNHKDLVRFLNCDPARLSDFM
jgi:hypothetical protein